MKHLATIAGAIGVFFFALCLPAKASQINLTWTASIDNVGVVGYKIFRDGAQIATTAATSYSDIGLSPSTTYVYAVSAFDAAGNNSAQSASVSVKTLASADTVAPSIPTNLTAIAVSPVAQVPSGLPTHFAFGLRSDALNQGWMPASGVPWDYRYQYLNHDWESWNSPPGQIATNYITFSRDNGYIAVFDWYFAGSQNHSGTALMAHLATPAKMHTYFTSFKLLLQKAAAFSSPVIVHVEPDMWAFLQQQGSSDPNTITVSVASSGFLEVGGFANTASGFAKALVKLRDTYASKVLLAWDNAMWAVNYDPTSTASPTAAGTAVAGFYEKLGANFDLIFYNTSDRDSGYKVAVLGQTTAQAWWTDTAFNNFRQYVSTLHQETGLKGMMWQTPVGNTLYRTLNNTVGHYQDNRPEYFLKNGNRQHIVDFVNAGLIGGMFGFGQVDNTSYTDHRGDGITNPTAINGNTLMSIYSDDDGGFLRVGGAEYYSSGSVPIQ